MNDSERELFERINRAGHDAFGGDWAPSRAAIAPGRIELLGNHLDYNGGPVLAAAIDRVVMAAADDIGDELAVLAVDNPGSLPATIAADREWRNSTPPPQSIDYARGVVAALLDRSVGRLRRSARVAVAGDVPIGFGLSSSAALCVALASALSETPLAATDLVLTAQEAEHRAGTPCGTMDQSASVAGGVIRFNAATLAVERLAPDLGEFVFTVADSGVNRSLSASSYPRRVEESTRALELARQHLDAPIPHLSALKAEQFAWLERRHVFPPPLHERVRHVVTEAERVERGTAALRDGDWSEFGRLMSESGASSATDYAISHPQVEALVAETRAIDGVLGARMMGGGEGGTVLALVRRTSVPEVEQRLRQGYYARNAMTDRRDLIHQCAFATGARVEAIP